MDAIGPTWKLAGSVFRFPGQKFANPAMGLLVSRSSAQVPANATIRPCTWHSRAFSAVHRETRSQVASRAKLNFLSSRLVFADGIVLQAPRWTWPHVDQHLI